MKLIKIITGTLLCALLTSSVYAVDIVTGNPWKKNKSGYTEAIIVDNYDLGGDASTTKVFTEAEGTSMSDGWIPIAANNDSITFWVNLKTLGSTTVTLTFEGKIDDDFSASTGGSILLFTKAFTSTNTQYSLPVCEGSLKYVRVGMQSDDGGTDDLTIKMRAERLRK